MRRMLLAFAVVCGTLCALQRLVAEQPVEEIMPVGASTPEPCGAVCEVAYVEDGQLKTRTGAISRLDGDQVLLISDVQTGIPLPILSSLFKNVGRGVVAIRWRDIRTITPVAASATQAGHPSASHQAEHCCDTGVCDVTAVNLTGVWQATGAATTASRALAAGPGCDEPAVPAGLQITSCSGLTPGASACVSEGTGQCAGACSDLRPAVFPSGNAIGVDFQFDQVCTQEGGPQYSAALPARLPLFNFVPATTGEAMRMCTSSACAACPAGPAGPAGGVSMEEYLSVAIRAARLEAQLEATQQLLKMQESLAEHKVANAALQSQLAATRELIELHGNALTQHAELAANSARLEAAVEAREAVIAQLKQHGAEVANRESLDVRQLLEEVRRLAERLHRIETAPQARRGDEFDVPQLSPR